MGTRKSSVAIKGEISVTCERKQKKTSLTRGVHVFSLLEGTLPEAPAIVTNFLLVPTAPSGKIPRGGNSA